MNERIKKATTFVKDKWTGFTTPIRIMIIAIPVVLIAIIIILVNLLNHKDEAELYTGLTTSEAVEIAAAIEDLGVQGAKVSGGTITVPSDQVDYLHMQLAVQGYPKSSPDYSIWKDGINIWSTDSDKRQVARQQLETRIAATLRQLATVQNATANLNLPDEPQYSIKPEKEDPSCAVVLTLKGEEELKTSEVRAIYDLVAKSVEGLTYDNISLVDNRNHMYEYITKEEEEELSKDPSGVNVARKRFTFEREMEQYLLQDLKNMMDDIYGEHGYALNVKSHINFDSKEVTTTEYFPVDENNTGVKHHELHIDQNIGLLGANGLVGFEPNADASPDYPQISGTDEEGEYYFKKDEIEYDVTNVVTKVTKDGYSIDGVTVGVALNQSEITERDREQVRALVAKAAGALETDVAVIATPFAIRNNVGNKNPINIITSGEDSYRNMMLMIVIALGVILVVLLIVSLFMSKSRKKKIRRRQELALAAAQAAADNTAQNDSEPPKEVDFNIASLTEEAGKESKETILKREIAEFARTSPEIVASIIRNMLREE